MKKANDNSRHITQEEEGPGKYVTKSKAVLAAKLETQRTHFPHSAVFTYYRLLDGRVVTCWTVVLLQKSAVAK